MSYLKSFIPSALNKSDALIALSSLSASLFAAEFLFKFGSFTLECLAFLSSWYFLFKTVKFITDRKSN